MTNKNLLRILFVEDLPSDVELAVLALRKEGLRFEHIRVDTRDEFIKALKEFIPDIVISDYMMPSYNGMQALKDAREFDPSVPFILLTGSMNEETAVECLKAGANDYVIKEHLTRLPYAVKEALEQHRMQIEKRAAELLLKENEEKLQSIFSAAPVGIGLVVNHIFIEVNDTFCKMTGFNRQELIGKRAEMIYATDGQNESAGIVIYRHIVERGTGSVETHFKCKDGRILNIFLSSSPLDKNDLTKGVIFIAMDITEKIKAEEALAKEEYLIYSLMNTLPDYIYFKDKKSRFIRINIAQALRFGLSDPAQAIGKKDSDFFTDEHAQKAYEDEQMIIRTGQPLSTEERETYPNRPDTWVSTIKLPLRDKEGNIIGTFGISRDITKSKLAEIALRKSEEKYRRIFENVQDMYYEVLIDGTILEVSPSIEILSKGQYHMDDLIGKSMFDFYPEPKERHALLAVLKEKGAVTDFEITLKNRDGSHVSCSISSKICFDAQGRPEKIIGSMRDITERKRAEEELINAKDKAEESDRLKTAFLHNISHEIRTPMNAIVGFSALLGEPDVDAQSHKSYTEIIMQSSNHLLAIINDIVDISNIEANLIKIVKNEININSTLKSLCDQFLLKAGEKKIKLVSETGLSNSNAFVLADSTKLTQILSNLINNAIKFTDKGYVKVGCTLRDKFLEFYVSDTGIGIPQEHHQRIFDRFYKIENPVSEFYEGTGLGLAISKAYVELQGGEIWLSSKPGAGSTFYFTLPFEKPADTIKTAPQVKTETGSVFPDKKTILVAEDIDSNFKLINYFLSGANAVVIRASNGKEAIEKALTETNIDLILMDIKMPVIDGYSAAKIIKESKPDIPIIAQTAYADDKTRALEEGCDGFLSKPFDKQKLLNAIMELI